MAPPMRYFDNPNRFYYERTATQLPTPRGGYVPGPGHDYTATPCMYEMRSPSLGDDSYNVSFDGIPVYDQSPSGYESDAFNYDDDVDDDEYYEQLLKYMEQKRAKINAAQATPPGAAPCISCNTPPRSPSLAPSPICRRSRCAANIMDKSVLLGDEPSGSELEDEVFEPSIRRRTSSAASLMTSELNCNSLLQVSCDIISL
ncbi:uncharacterized protein LOC144820269 [Lissotriton helveticus]